MSQYQYNELYMAYLNNTIYVIILSIKSIYMTYLNSSIYVIIPSIQSVIYDLSKQ